MEGTLLKELSDRKFNIVMGIIVVALACYFATGGLVAPVPCTVMSILATKCIDKNSTQGEWYWSRGKHHCKSVSDFSDPFQEENMTLYDVIFTFQIPIPRSGIELHYSRWQQNLIALLNLDVIYETGGNAEVNANMSIEARLGYSNKGDPEGHWTEYASSTEMRRLDCSIEQKRPGYMYNCAVVPLFELGSLHHDYYLLNIRFPVDSLSNPRVPETFQQVPHLSDMWVKFIHQNGGFTKVWMSNKTVYFPMLVASIVLFWWRISQLSRPPALLEYMLMVLGAGLSLLNCPIEYLTLYFDCPWMGIVNDVREIVFYSSMFSFWHVFVGEPFKDRNDHSAIRIFCQHLILVSCLFIFNLYEKGMQLCNPFYSIWASETDVQVALSFIVLQTIFGALYFCFLAYMLWKMTSKSNFNRVKILLRATFVCAALTLIDFILKQISKSQHSWEENIKLEYTSGFFTGVYVMWNIYTLTLLFFFTQNKSPTISHAKLSDACN